MFTFDLVRGLKILVFPLAAEHVAYPPGVNLGTFALDMKGSKGIALVAVIACLVAAVYTLFSSVKFLHFWA